MLVSRIDFRICLFSLYLLALVACSGGSDDGNGNEYVLAAPTDLTASVSAEGVSLSWGAVAAANSYKVYKDAILLDSVSSSNFIEPEVADGTYLYEVSSVNDSGESASKASISVNVDNSFPAAPAALVAAVDSSSVSLSWESVDRASAYKIYRDGNNLDSVSATSFSDNNLDYASYFYEVTSLNDFGESVGRASVTVVVSTEPLRSHQWHLTNTGQSVFAASAGRSGEDINHSGALALGVTGAGVRVNVIDTGLELQHPDLQANIVPGGSYDYVDGDNDPTNNYETAGDHGTSVAGLIAAAGDNSIGISGVARAAQIQGYNYLTSDPQTDANYILAHGLDDKLTDTDIFNKSLGSTRTADALISSNVLDTLSCLTTGGSFDMSAGSSCYSALRSGLGAIYVKSAGNDFTVQIYNGGEYCEVLGLTCWNANMQPEQTYPYQLIVGALNAEGEKASYSTAGSAIWVSAPGGEYGLDYQYFSSQLEEYGLFGDWRHISGALWQPAMLTTDQVGCNRGYTTTTYDFGIAGVLPLQGTRFHVNKSLNSNCEYTSIFRGTSAAAPVLSGVVALMLEANPSLSWRDVKHILAQSARLVDSNAAALDVPAAVCVDSACSSYELSSSVSFTARDAWITNAAGYSYHNWYGFGGVNAGAAVAMAQNYSSTLGSWQKDTYSQSAAAAIPDATGAAASTSLTVSAAMTVEAVQLHLSITHAAIGELAVVLYSPANTRSVLLTPYNQYGADANFSSTLLSNAFYGESSAGEWRLEIYDLWEKHTGSLNSATISFYGS